MFCQKEKIFTNKELKDCLKCRFRNCLFKLMLEKTLEILKQEGLIKGTRAEIIEKLKKKTQ